MKDRPLFFSTQRKRKLAPIKLDFHIEMTIAHHSIQLEIAQQKCRFLFSFYSNPVDNVSTCPMRVNPMRLLAGVSRESALPSCAHGE
jgi:hypothetical protein